jgi:hypothetical protein
MEYSKLILAWAIAKAILRVELPKKMPTGNDIKGRSITTE